METSNKIFTSQASQFINYHKPIVFWDTCSLLDIIRLPCRIHNDTVLHQYERLLELIEADIVVSVTSHMVIHEFDSHYTNEKGTLVSEQNHRKNLINEFVHYVHEPDKSTISTGVSLLKVEDRLEDLVFRIWKKTYIIRGVNEFSENAQFRLENRIAPAKVKDEYKDCYIWYSFQKLASELPGHGYMTFLTANKDDYVDVLTNSLFTELQAECASTGTSVDTAVGPLLGKLRGYIQP